MAETKEKTPDSVAVDEFLDYCKELDSSITQEDIDRARSQNPLMGSLSLSSARNIVLSLREEKEELDKLPEKRTGIWLGSSDQTDPAWRKGRATDACLLDLETLQLEGFYMWGGKPKNLASAEELKNAHVTIVGEMDAGWTSEDGQHHKPPRMKCFHVMDIAPRDPEAIDKLVIDALTPYENVDGNCKGKIVAIVGRIVEVWSAKDFEWGDTPDGKRQKATKKTHQLLTAGESTFVLKLEEIPFQQYNLRMNVSLMPQELGQPIVTIPNWETILPVLQGLRKDPKKLFKEVSQHSDAEKRFKALMDTAIEQQIKLIEPVWKGMSCVAIGRVSEAYFTTIKKASSEDGPEGDISVLTVNLHALRLRLYPREVDLPLPDSAVTVTRRVAAAAKDSLAVATANEILSSETFAIGTHDAAPAIMVQKIAEILKKEGLAYEPQPGSLKVLGGNLTPEMLVDLRVLDEKYPPIAKATSQPVEPVEPPTADEQMAAAALMPDIIIPPERKADSRELDTKVPTTEVPEISGAKIAAAMKVQPETKPKPKAKVEPEPEPVKETKVEAEEPIPGLRDEISRLRTAIPTLTAAVCLTVLKSHDPQKYAALSIEVIKKVGGW